MVVALGLALSLYSRTSPSKSRAKTVAVLPFQNTGADPSVDFLGLAIPDEIARMLSYARYESSDVVRTRGFESLRECPALVRNGGVFKSCTPHSCLRSACKPPPTGPAMGTSAL